MTIKHILVFAGFIIFFLNVVSATTVITENGITIDGSVNASMFNGDWNGSILYYPYSNPSGFINSTYNSTYNSYLGFNPFDQSLNTTSNVTFGGLSVNASGFAGIDINSLRTGATQNIGGVRFHNSTGGEVASYLGTVRGDLNLQAGGQTSRIFINGTSGNVGIGTTSPNGLLDLNGTGMLLFANSSALTGGGVFIDNGGRRLLITGQPLGQDFTQAPLAVNAIAQGAAGRKLFGVGINNAERFSINVAGDINATAFSTLGSNFGIGTTSPSQKLEVVGNVNISSGGNLTVSNIGIGTTNLTAGLVVVGDDIYLDRNNRLYFYASQIGSRDSIGSDAGNNILFYTTGVTSGALNITTSGNVIIPAGNLSVASYVGIGTTVPTAPLTVSTNDSNQISIWAVRNISATGFITRTETYDKSRGSAFNFINDASSYINPDGTINHTAFYGYVDLGNVPDYANPTTSLKDNTTEITYNTVHEEGVDLGAEVAMLTQALYEQKLINQQYKSALCTIKPDLELCKL